MITREQDVRSMGLAIERARAFVGSTAPNPPVGSVAVDADGNILSALAHERAGEPHAEARVIADLRERGLLEKAQRLYVTLEPCNHTGRTPPCSGAILGTPIKEVRYGHADPNPVAAGGAAFLRAHGVDAQEQTETAEACADLLAPFLKRLREGMPYVVVKTAHRAGIAVDESLASMAPPPGQTTFTSPESLTLAHRLRRESDAILTTARTIVIDHPRFTVRLVPDFAGKRRFLAVFGKTPLPADYAGAARDRGLDLRIATQSVEAELRFLAGQGVQQVLVEAGPTFSRAMLATSFWDRHVRIIQADEAGMPDTVSVRRRAKP